MLWYILCGAEDWLLFEKRKEKQLKIREKLTKGNNQLKDIRMAKDGEETSKENWQLETTKKRKMAMEFGKRKTSITNEENSTRSPTDT